MPIGSNRINGLGTWMASRLHSFPLLPFHFLCLCYYCTPLQTADARVKCSASAEMCRWWRGGARQSTALVDHALLLTTLPDSSILSLSHLRPDHALARSRLRPRLSPRMPLCSVEWPAFDALVTTTAHECMQVVTLPLPLHTHLPRQRRHTLARPRLYQILLTSQPTRMMRTLENDANAAI